MLRVDVFRHRVTRCPCGHSTHSGQTTITSRSRGPAGYRLECRSCGEREKAENLALSFVSAERLHLFREGMEVKHGDGTKRIIAIEPVRRLPALPAQHYALLLRAE